MDQKQLEKVVATIIETQDNNFKHIEKRINKIEELLKEIEEALLSEANEEKKRQVEWQKLGLKLKEDIKKLKEE